MGLLFVSFAALSVIIPAQLPIQVTLSVIAAAVLASIVGVVSDVQIGSLAGIFASAAALLFVRAIDPEAANSLPVAASTFAVTGFGLLAGSVGSALNDGWESTQAVAGEPVFGSLGLLAASLGETRLAEEIERAQFVHSPLSVLIVTTQIDKADLSAEDERAVARVSARALESSLRLIDVTFGYSERRLGAVLPECDREMARRIAYAVWRATNSAVVLVGPARDQRPFPSLASVRVGIGTLDEDCASASALLEAAASNGVEYGALSTGRRLKSAEVPEPVLPASAFQPADPLRHLVLTAGSETSADDRGTSSSTS